MKLDSFAVGMVQPFFGSHGMSSLNFDMPVRLLTKRWSGRDLKWDGEKSERKSSELRAEMSRAEIQNWNINKMQNIKIVFDSMNKQKILLVSPRLRTLYPPSSLLLNFEFSFRFDLYWRSHVVNANISGISEAVMGSGLKRSMMVRFVHVHRTWPKWNQQVFSFLSHLISNKHFFFSSHCRFVRRERWVYFPSCHRRAYNARTIITCHLKISKIVCRYLILVDDSLSIFAFVCVEMSDVFALRCASRLKN